MPAPLDRATLLQLKRADLQKICKDYGIKANLKTEALIDLLVDTTQAAVRPIPPAPRQRAPSTRIASRSSAASRLRGASSSSMIIHDTDEEDDVPPTSGRGNVHFVPQPEPPSVPVPAPRARRPKDTQYKLGVGRPTAVGGRGPRNVTRSTSMAQKGKRAKGSKSVKPTEAAIQEEEEPDPIQSDMPEAGPSGTPHEPLPPEPPTILPPVEHYPILDPLADALADLIPLPPPTADPSEQVKIYVTNLVSPLQTQVQLLQTELQQRSAQMADMSALSDQVRLLRAEVETLRSQAALVPQLQSEVNELRQAVATLMQESTTSRPSEKSLGKARASDEGSCDTVVGGSLGSGPTPIIPQGPPGPSQPTLGKRHREADDSHTDAVEAGQEVQEEQGKRGVRPSKKRPKLSKQEEVHPAPSSARPPAAIDSGSGETQLVPRGLAFTVFQGPEEMSQSHIEPPPPTLHLSDLFPFGPTDGEGQVTPPNGAGGAIARPPGADENAPLDPNINFSFEDASLFNPVTSTPFNSSLPPFTYPEPPTSPSPAAPTGGFVERAGGRIERNDLFQPLRRFTPATTQLRTPSRSQSNLSNTQAGFSQESAALTINPTALMHTPALPSVPEMHEVSASTSSAGVHLNGLPRRTVSSTEVGMQLGMSSAAQLPPDTPGVPMKRTMYGTELEDDTRFGDFGVEGVASGFWAGLRPRP